MMPYRWAVFAFVCSLLAITANASCDKFDIRLSGQTLLALNSDTKTMEITNDLELGAISTNQIILGDYLFGVHNVLGEAQLGLRKRKIDADTGKYHVPRAIRGFAHNGTSVIYDHEFRDASEFSLAELRDFMREVLANELEMEGHNDPFNLAARYTAAGEWCKDTNPLADCVATRDDIFVLVSTEESRIVLSDYASLWDRDAQPGDSDYTGSVRTLTSSEEPMVGGDIGGLESAGGLTPGAPGFRYSDSEVQDVYWLQAAMVEEYEVTPGVVISLMGWRGGKVMDFSLADGVLIGGFVVVGPHPSSDPNDMVSMSAGDFGNLEVRSPGPALRFTPGTVTRIYVSNKLGRGVSVNWGIVTPHDQDGAIQVAQAAIGPDGIHVYEFIVPSSTTGATTYSDHDHLSGPIVLPHEHDVHREYIVFADGEDMLNGNTFPGTLQRLSGWYLDTMRIKESKLSEDGSGDTLVTIMDEARLPHPTSSDDAHAPNLRDDCPAYGGPLEGRFGTGCIVDGIHVHRGHNIPSMTYSPGTAVWIDGHNDNPVSSINGMHMVKREDLNSFRIRKVGSEGSSGGVGGFVRIWRLHKSSYIRPELQNNGVSGGYIRFNYNENILLRFVNSGAEELHMHLHGHTFQVVSEDGAAISVTRAETGLSVSAGGSIDAIVAASNPNRLGAWRLGNDAYHVSSREAWTPWPDASLVSAGSETWVDYTGFSQGEFALNEDGDVAPLNTVPPQCSVQNEEIHADTDNLNIPFDKESRATYVLLSGMAEFLEDPLPKAPFGDNSQISYSWTVVKTPLGGTASVQMVSGGMAYLTSISMPGTYVVRFQATGFNAYRAADNDMVSCWKDVIVHFCESGKCSMHSDVGNLPLTFVSPAVSSLRVGLMDAPAADSKKRHHDAGEYTQHMPSPVGHATFRTYPAGTNAAPTSFTVKTAYPSAGGVWSWLNAGARFYRWYNEGENTDFWMDIDPATSAQKSTWNWAIKQVVFDARLETFGGILATSLGSGVADGALPPLNGDVMYPMYQGLSTHNGDHDVYFLILEASDADFCEEFNCHYTPSLGLIPPSSLALNRATHNPMDSGKNNLISQRLVSPTFASRRATHFVFTQDPDSLPALGGPSGYSPLKWVSYTNAAGESKHFVANMPFIYWGRAFVQVNSPVVTPSNGNMLIPYTADCDPLIRDYPPYSGTDWNGGQFPKVGPAGSCVYANTVRGPQLSRLPNFWDMTVVMKTTRAAFKNDEYVYYTLTDSSDQIEAQMNGIPWTPALNNLGRAGDVPYVSSIRAFGNGVAGTGRFGFQHDIVGTHPALTSYTPFLQLTNVFWNCGTFPFLLTDLTGVTTTDAAMRYKSEPYTMHNVVGREEDIYLKSANKIFGTTPASSDVYQLAANIKGAMCAGYAASFLEEGSVAWYNDIRTLLGERALYETENPAGSYLASSRTTNSILNAHVPYIWRPSVLRDMEDYTTVAMTLSPPILQGSWVVLFRPPKDANLGPRVENKLMYRSLLSAPYTQMDYGLTGDFPPADNPLDAWKCFAGVSQYDCTRGSMLQLNVPTSVYDPNTRGNVQFSVLECSDQTFSSIFGVRHVANLEKVPRWATTSAVWWTEPEPEESGLYSAASVMAAMNSFIFGELNTPAATYSPLKLFSFQNRPVICNMPFASALTLLDQGGCSAAIRGDLYGNPAVNGVSGPPGCTTNSKPLLRSQGAQALARTANSITMKVHRALNRDTMQWSYYTLWDSSNPIAASYNGVPTSGRLSVLATDPSGLKKVGVDTLKQFANGVPCPGCIEGGQDFQDPIIGVEYSPLHAVTNLLWNCDNALPAGSANSVFTDKNFADSINCGNNPNCDPYPLRVDLKRKVCPETVLPHSTRGQVFFNDEVALIKSGMLFETFTPVGQPPSGKAGVVQEITNTPVVVQLNFGLPSMPFTRHIHIVATSDSNRWVWWVDMMPFHKATPPMMSSNWAALTPASGASVMDGSVGKIWVKVGDTISFYSSSMTVPHGLVLSDKNVYSSASEGVGAFFSTLYSPSMATETSSADFTNLYGHSGWATPSMYGGYLFAGVVRDNVVGTRLHFSDPVFGPFAMNGVLELTK